MRKILSLIAIGMTAAAITFGATNNGANAACSASCCASGATCSCNCGGNPAACTCDAGCECTSCGSGCCGL